jgi:hypothetical protein
LRLAVTELDGEIKKLREDVALTAEVLLASAGKVNEDEARAWADENIR